MSLNTGLSDPFDIMSSLMAMHESGATWSSDPDEIIEILMTAAPGPEKWDPDPGEVKERIWNAVKEQAGLARHLHLLLKKQVTEYVASAQDAPEKDRLRAAFWLSQMVSANSPSNFFWTNPTAVKQWLDSNGRSLARGMENWLADLNADDPLVKISDPRSFRLGEDLAGTPGKVVLRNQLMELIQYEPSTLQTHGMPVVLIQPWINKYYIFDLTEENSLVRYLRDRGFTVFITSWKNPGTGMREIDLDDYLVDGIFAAVEAAREICGVTQVHAAGYCIGGTLLAAAMAWMNREFKPKRSLPVAHWTLFSSLVDFSDPGEIGVFISPKILETIESLMQGPGYLDKQYIGTAFRMLRPDSLIWRYFAHNYLEGGEPPKSDVLFWNSDNTRLPEKMTSRYLRECYLDNRLCQKDALVLCGRPIDLGNIGQPLYAVGAFRDHISPWKQTFRICGLIKAETRYVLSIDGHIAGIVSPPSKHNRRKYRAGTASASDSPDHWYRNQNECLGSWWPDWAEWLSRKCGPLVSPPGTGSDSYPAMGNAPGTYVLEP